MSKEFGAALAAQLTLNTFERFSEAFRAITRRAQQRFESMDWAGGRRDSAERLDAYGNSLDDATVQLNASLGSLAHKERVWISAKAIFAGKIAGRHDVERAETFFNSVTRRMLGTAGINRNVEFFLLQSRTRDTEAGNLISQAYTKTASTCALVQQLLSDLPFNVPFEDIEGDALCVAREIDLYLWPLLKSPEPYRIDRVKAIFYRNKVAYVIGRIVLGPQIIPLIIPLANGERGIRAETVLLEEAEASNVFSFAYSHFFVDVERYDALIEFLRSVLPHASSAELYTSIGYNRHGKTEFYRDLHRFVHVSQEQFVAAPGQEGAVMIVFTLPNFNFVFKVIKDRPCFLRSNAETPKMISKERVRFQYNYVLHRDRAGRMVDTQEFENLRFKKKRFSSNLLAEFAQAGKTAVTVSREYVVIQHLYVQRKVIPLPMYFQNEGNPERIRSVLVDFGYFLKDLAASGVFPCDLFNTWNYGVTQWGRVVLYDYDDVLPLERVMFREKPAPRNEYEETEPEENWIFAREEEFFVDEMERYSGIPQPLRGFFASVHSDLYSVKFWNSLTERVTRGEIFDVIPYDRAKRFHPPPADGS